MLYTKHNNKWPKRSAYERLRPLLVGRQLDPHSFAFPHLPDSDSGIPVESSFWTVG